MLFTALVLLMTSSHITQSALTIAVTVDLILTVPLVFYLLIRKTNIPVTTVLPILIIGILLGSYLLPPESQTYLSLFKIWGLPVVELTVLTYIIIKVRTAFKSFKNARGYTPDFLSATIKATNNILPYRVSVAFATEISVFYYSLFTWKPTNLQSNEFSYHIKSGSNTIYGAILFLISIETFILHLFIERSNGMVAWILTGLGIYTGIQILGLLKSLSRRPISVRENDIVIRYGVFYETVIPFSLIRSCNTIPNSELDSDNTTILSPIGDLESQNILIELHSEHILRGPYGIKKRFTQLGFYVDEPSRFKEMADALTQNRK